MDFSRIETLPGAPSLWEEQSQYLNCAESQVVLNEQNHSAKMGSR